MSHAWTITSPQVQRVIAFDPTIGLHTTHLLHRATGTDLLASARAAGRWSPEFEFCVDGAPLTSLGPEWALAGANPEPPTGLVIHLQHRTRPLALRVFYTCQPRATAKWYHLLNQGPRPITLSRVAIETLPVEIGPPGELLLDAHYGALPRETFYTGRVDDCALRLRNPRTGETVTALNEAPGHLKRTESGAWFWDGHLRLMYDTDLFPLEIQVPAGSAWGTAQARLCFGVEGRGELDPRWATPAAASAARRQPSVRPAWHYNTWDPFGTGINEATVLALLPIAAQMGFEIFTIDDGWQAAYGDNRVSPERFPGGLAPIRAAAEALGMRLGLWAPLAVVDRDLTAASPTLTAAQCREANGQPKTTRTAMGEHSVLCLASGYAAEAAARLNALIEHYHLAYLKLDLTTVFNAYGEAPGCHAPGHTHLSAAESVARIYEGIAQITRGVYARHPDVLIDLTFELWGQKHTIDYGLLRAADLSWISNVGDNTDQGAGPRQARTLLYHRALAIPAEAMLIGNLRADTGDPREKFATALGSCPLLLGDLRQLSPAQAAWYGRMIRWHQGLRRRVDLSPGVFPLGEWRQPSATAWDGFARLSPAGEGLLALFRNHSDAATARVQLPLPGAGVYALTEVETGEALPPRSAADFRAGFEVPFEAVGVRVLEVRRVD